MKAINTTTDALNELGPAPRAPLSPMITCPEPTYEGLCLLYRMGHPSLGVFSSEGGQFIGGHGMNQDNRLKTSTAVSALWDGTPSRNHEKWKRGLDLLEMLIVVCEETGNNINMTLRPKAVEERDCKFEAIISLHARAILVSREILCLLKNGFADGALGRWRTLHEIAVVARFLSSHDREIAKRYLLSRDVQSCKALRQYIQYQERANLKPLSEDDLNIMQEHCDAILRQCGQEMKNEWGWAAPVLNKSRPNFVDIEKSEDLDHWRPRYKWACEDTHGLHRPHDKMLATKNANEPILLVGQSNSGLTDPAQMTAITIRLATSAVYCLAPKLDQLIWTEVTGVLSDQVGEVMIEIEK